MCEKSKILTISIPTDDATILREVGAMFTRLSERPVVLTGRIDVPVLSPVENLQAGTPLPAGIPADPDGLKVDPGAAFAANQEQQHPAIAPLSPFPAGGVASPADLTPVIPPAVNTGAPAPGVPLDKSGLPWDARINTANKAQTAKGIWKRAPGLTDEVYQETLEQLKRTMAGAAPATTAEQALNQASMPLAGGAPVPPPAGPAATPPVPPAAEDVPTAFPQLLMAISKRTGANPPKITSDEISTVCALQGIESLAMLNNRPELIPAVYEELAKIWNTRA